MRRLGAGERKKGTMRNLAVKSDTNDSKSPRRPIDALSQRRPIAYDHGSVLRVEDGAFIVETANGERRAKRATSCLVEPTPDDLVLLATLGADRAYVLAVLEREAGAPCCLVADGDLAIKAASGELELAAAKDVRVVSGEEVAIVSSAVSVHAAQGNVAVGKLSFLTRLLSAELGRAKVFAESFDSMLDRLSQRVKRSYRVVEECDHLRAERIDYAAKGTLGLHGETALVTAERLAKVEGDQIHLG
jgi:hypothetical protein